MSQELRKYPRINTAMEITYQTRESLDDEDSVVHHFGTVTDLSKEGAGLLVDEAHQPDENIWLVGIGGTKTPLNSTVKWAREASGKYRVGVQFIYNS